MSVSRHICSPLEESSSTVAEEDDFPPASPNDDGPAAGKPLLLPITLLTRISKLTETPTYTKPPIICMTSTKTFSEEALYVVSL